MDRLWSPWRMQYVSEPGDPEECIFCSQLAAGDDESVHIANRGEHVFVILNAYPYNPGHLMVAPNRHVGELGDLHPDERHDLMDMTCTATGVLKEAMDPDGFNIGINLGEVAGAGIPGHLHVHIVPRWGGDTNFMPVVGETKVLPELIADTYSKLRPRFDRLT